MILIIFLMNTIDLKREINTQPQNIFDFFGCCQCNRTQPSKTILSHVPKRSQIVKIQHLKLSLKAKSSITHKILPIESLKMITKSQISSSLKPIQESVHRKQSMPPRIDQKVLQQQVTNNIQTKISQTVQLASQLKKNESLRSTNDTFFKPSLRLNSQKDIKPKVNFVYPQNLQDPNKNAAASSTQLPNIPVLRHSPISEIKDVSTPSDLHNSEVAILFDGAQSIAQSISPLNKIYTSSRPEILVSLQLAKKSSGSFQSSKRMKVKRIPSMNEPFSRAAMKVRQTVSIKQPQDESDMMSIVISNSLVNSYGHGLLIPIMENDMEKLSECREMKQWD